MVFPSRSIDSASNNPCGWNDCLPKDFKLVGDQLSSGELMALQKDIDKIKVEVPLYKRVR